jgi:ubiquitin C-terminal hydrolase
MKNISSDYSPFLQADSQNFGIDIIDEIIKNIKGEENFSSDYQNNNVNEIMLDLYKKDKYKNFINKYQKNEISIEKMFLINELDIFYDSNRVSNIRFNSSYQIELSIPSNRNNFINEYSLKDLLDFKFERKQNNLDNNNSISRICKLPEILIITISRSVLGEKFKNEKINIPTMIDLLDYIDKDLINKRNTKYKLFGINEKNGNSKTSGHYYSYIFIANKWHWFNDTETKEEEPNFSSRNVVGLFYKEVLG